MGSTDPLTGARFPYGSDPATIAQYIENAVRDLSDNAIPRFASAAARDAAFNAWVAAGNTMVDGLHCTVAGIDQVYRSGAWRGIGYFPVLIGAGPSTFGPYTIPVGSASPLVIGRITVADPGFPYRLRTYAGAEIYPCDSSGNPIDSSVTRVDSWMDINGAKFDYWRGDVGNFHKHADLSPQLTGSVICNFLAARVVPADVGYWQSSPYNFYMTAEIVPA